MQLLKYGDRSHGREPWDGPIRQLLVLGAVPSDRAKRSAGPMPFEMPAPRRGVLRVNGACNSAVGCALKALQQKYQPENSFFSFP